MHSGHKRARDLIPRFDGTIFSQPWKEAIPKRHGNAGRQGCDTAIAGFARAAEQATENDFWAVTGPQQTLRHNQLLS